MNIPESFKEAIANTFYDKTIEVWKAGIEEDEEGAIVGSEKLDKLETIDANFKFRTRDKIKEEYGETMEANVVVTCDTTVAEIGDVIVYEGKEYVITSVIKHDSHMVILAKGGE